MKNPQYALAIDGPHCFVREQHTVIANDYSKMAADAFGEPRPVQKIAAKVRVWYVNLRTGDIEYVDAPDDEFSIGRAIIELQAKADLAAKRDDKKWPGDKIVYASPLPEVIKTLYNGEYGRDCRRRKAA